jgi:ABC-type Na+ efflux pump permease subunit
MSTDIKEQVSNLPDEEILKMLSTHFPDYRNEWINISQEELRKRGFVLEPTDTELKVITPAGQKLVYPKIQSDVWAKSQDITESAEPAKASWTPFTILLAIISFVAALIVTGIFSAILISIAESMESPQSRFPDWVAKMAAILIVGIFIAIWKVIFGFLASRFDA